YLAGSELPAVIVDIGRVGPGLGNIYPDQSDYNQVVKGGGHGAYRSVVLAPNSVQEMCDFTMRAFELADRYRGPVFVLSDAYVGQMMEPVAFPEPLGPPPEKPWALNDQPETSDNVITSIYLNPDEMEDRVVHLQEVYDRIQKNEVLFEEYHVDDADWVLVGFGVVSRLLRSIVEQARAEGLKVGLFRPQTLWPFPTDRIRALSEKVDGLMVVEMNNGQMVDDVKLTIEGRCPVEFINRMGGNVPDSRRIANRLRELVKA
ncbi:MAG: 3-methyl-2-oxobutanoate dehydrogenase subunit beta, partial [Candidatus Sumerlaeota bacterium]